MATTSTSNAGSLLSQASAMVAQTQAQGSTPFAGSSFSGGGGSNIKQETRYGQSGYVLPSGQWVNAQYASPDVSGAFASGGQWTPNQADATITPAMLEQKKITVPSLPDTTETEKLGLTVGNQNAQKMEMLNSPDIDNISNAMQKIFGTQDSSLNTLNTMTEQAGLKQSISRINELRNQIALQNDFLNAGISKIGNEAIATPIIGKQQRLLQDQQGRKIALLSAQLEAEQGNFNMAKDLVNMQYQAWKADSDRQFQVKTAVLDQLNRYEDKKFDLYKMKVENDYTQANKLEENRRQILTNYYQAGGKSGVTADAIGNAKTFDELMAVGGRYTMSALESQQLTNARLQGQKLRQEITPSDAEGGELYSGLKPATATAVRSQVSAFKTEPLVQNFAVIQEGRNFSNSISSKTTNPADDQALIYSLAKSLDPGSVVREGEYATAQKYAQSWVKAYGKGVTQAIAGTGFLSETARNNIKKTIETKYQSSKRSYDNIEGQYVVGINNLTGRNDGTKFLRSYVTPQNETVENSKNINAWTQAVQSLSDKFYSPTGGYIIPNQ